MQGLQAPGAEVRLQEADVVEQQRATQAAEGAYQDHHQAHEAHREDVTNGLDGCQYPSRTLALPADVRHLLRGDGTHARRIGGFAILARLRL